MAIPPSVTRLVWSLAFIGVTESDDDTTRAQKAALTLAASLITGLAVVWVATYLVLGLATAAAIPFAYQIASVEPIGLDLSIRIGMESGPVIAGVIGRDKFIYDLWGDTVNTASRLESHGLPGRIQVGEAAYRLLCDRYAFEDRGEIEMKGKGRRRAYLLIGRLGS